MKRYFPFILSAIFLISTAAMCTKNDTPSPSPGDKPAITADQGNRYLIYTADLQTPRTLSFTITNADESLVVTAMAENIKAAVKTEKGYGSTVQATVTIETLPDFADTTTLVITAQNTIGTSIKEFGLSQARMEVPQTEFNNVPSAGDIITIPLVCNVDANIEVTEGKDDMLSLGVDGKGKLACIVQMNPEMKPRSGKIVITDFDGILPEVTVTVNQLASAIPAELNEATDRQALRAICEALHMQDWLDDTECIKWDRPIREWNTTFTGERIQRLGLGNAGREIIHYGVIPDELGWLNCITTLEISDEISGPLPKTLGGCRSLTNITMYQSAKITEKLNDSSIKDVIGHLYTLMLAPGYYGSFPEWFANMPETGKITATQTHLSGQIPDRVANMKPMQKDWALGLTILDAFIVRAKSYYNYALWVGEQPSNVKFVDDEHDGHWEWTDTIFDETTQRWKQENDIYSEDCTFWYKSN